jgi:hypothetical protein
MASQQDYLDDLERKHMVRVSTNEKGEKSYDATHAMMPPPFYCQPYDASIMFPEQWRDKVLANFQTQYLNWWYNAFVALKAQQDQQAFSDGSGANIGADYNPATGLYEPRSAKK